MDDTVLDNRYFEIDATFRNVNQKFNIAVEKTTNSVYDTYAAQEAFFAKHFIIEDEGMFLIDDNIVSSTIWIYLYGWDEFTDDDTLTGNLRVRCTEWCSLTHGQQLDRILDFAKKRISFTITEINDEVM